MRSLSSVNRQLRQISSAIISICLACLVLSALMARIIARMGLKPVSNLAAQIGGIDEEKLDTHLDCKDLPEEIAPIAESTNALLGRLQRAFDNERRFSADAAHELRTPIATMKSGVQVALLKPDLSQNTLNLLNALLLDVDRLEQLCDALLLMTTGESRCEAPLTGGDWIVEIELAVVSTRTKMMGNSYTLSTTLSVPEELKDAALKTTASQTFRTIANLVENAVRYGGEGVKIEVVTEWRKSDSAVRLIVEDNGRGIPEESAPLVFERFYRVEKSRARKQGGFGLGLSLCRSLARASGGDLIYEPGETRGARFIWIVPLADNQTCD